MGIFEDYDTLLLRGANPVRLKPSCKANHVCGNEEMAHKTKKEKAKNDE